MLHNSKCLWFTCCVSVSMILVNLAASNSITRTDMDEEESLATQMELDEYDFEDLCHSQLLPSEWANNIANRNLRTEVSESLAGSQREKAIEDYSGHTAGLQHSKRAAEVTRKLELISKPGDVLLRQEDYQQLLTFPDKVSAGPNISIDCETSFDSANDTLESSSVPNQSNQSTCGHNNTEYLRQEYSRLLELVPKAAKLNGFDNVESYWLLLSELPDDGYQRAKTLWTEVKPLYQKLSRWISESIDKKCRSKRDAETSYSSACESSHSIEWRFTHDWTNLADLVLPKECLQTFHKLQTNLEENKISGKQLFERTEKMSKILQLGNLPSSFWEDSLFNQSCPSRYLDSCKGDFRVAACSLASWSNYLDAHEISIRAISSKLSNSNTALTYLLKNGNRFSASSDAVAGLATLIAANRHYLAQQGIIKNTPCAKDTLVTLLALRIIPKISFYLLADLARIEAINSNGTTDILSAWRSHWNGDESKGTSVEENDWRAFLGEERIAANQPYISQFYGLLIQFQLFEELLKSDESVSDEGEEFIRSSQQIRELLELGKSKKWPQLLQDSFQISKITSAPLVRFFNRFDTFISPFIVPKDTKKMSVLLPNPDLQIKTATEETSVPKKQSTTTPTILPNYSEDILGSNGSQIVVDSSGKPVENSDYIIGAVIACIVVGAIAIVVVAYKRHLVKTSQYQRPANQPT